jgi:hypothetical protein
METPAEQSAERAATIAKLCWHRPTPGRLLVVLLAAEGILLLSERFQWFPFNEKKGWTVLIAIAAVGAAMLLLLLWYALALLFRWRFQFSIRSLLLLTVAVAVPSSWLAVEMKRAREQKEVVDALVAKGGELDYRNEMTIEELLTPSSASPGFLSKNQFDPNCLEKVLGIDFFRNVTWIDLTRITDGELKMYKELKELSGIADYDSIVLSNTRITDADLA